MSGPLTVSGWASSVRAPDVTQTWGGGRVEIGSRHGLRMGALMRVVAVMTVVGTVLGFSAVAGAATWRWSKPSALPHAPTGISGISCATAKVCVTAGEVGNPDLNSATQGVFSTNNPAGGTSSWHYLPLEPLNQPMLSISEEPFTAVSCTEPGPGDPAYCAATDGFANLWQTGNPLVNKTWGQTIPDQIAMESLSCWPARCAMLDIDGNAVVTVGAVAQNETNVFGFDATKHPGDFAGSIGCDRTNFCAAVESGTRKVGWTTDAPAVPAVWHTSTIHGKASLGQIACPTLRLCVATEAQPGSGFIAGPSWIGVSRNPAGGGGTWKSVKLPSADEGISEVNCASASLCAVGGSTGIGDGAAFVLTSTDPTASTSKWHRTNLPVTALAGLSCPTTSECVAVGYKGSRLAVTVGRVR